MPLSRIKLILKLNNHSRSTPSSADPERNLFERKKQRKQHRDKHAVGATFSCAYSLLNDFSYRASSKKLPTANQLFQKWDLTGGQHKLSAVQALHFLDSKVLSIRELEHHCPGRHCPLIKLGLPESRIHDETSTLLLLVLMNRHIACIPQPL